MKLFSRIVIILIVLLGITFAALNSEKVIFHYYLGNRSISLALLLACAFGAGIILTFFFMGITVLRLKHQKRKLKKQLNNALQEVDNLRKIPIKEGAV